MSPSSVLIVGAQRGLGTALTKRYGELVGSSGRVFATAEKPVDPGAYLCLTESEMLTYRAIFKIWKQYYRD